ncbi:hypothetical protein GCM10009789_38740 [Kribbella sancticallisti]|uniref:Uncharacterized protein n=1 Tax=Kribbella sancticallisti TaxID=460087 RepID=A0ABN2DMY5_9ACTN
MDDVRDLGAQLHRLAATDPLDPIDATALLERSRRRKRRRRLRSIGGVTAGVAAVALAASLMPNLSTANDDPRVAGSVTPKPVTITKAAGDSFTSVPGVPRGEAGLAGPLPMAETIRRCTLRYPQNKRPLKHKGQWAVGETLPYVLQPGDRPMMCTIPGGDKPSDQLVAAARRDPMPSSPAAQLRNCSVLFWSDLTNWRVVASETAPGVGTALMALSPSGRKVLNCQLGPKTGDNATPLGAGPGIYPATNYDTAKIEPWIGGHLDCPTYGVPCRGFAYVGAGRVSPKVTRMRIEPTNGTPGHDVMVRDGWYAVAWFAKGNFTEWGAQLTAYDRTGNVLKTITR